jgi:hypothetical protein
MILSFYHFKSIYIIYKYSIYFKNTNKLFKATVIKNKLKYLNLSY